MNDTLEKEWGPSLGISKEIQRCSSCLILQSLDRFSRDLKNSNKKSHLCKNCAKEETKKWRENNLEKAKASIKSCWDKNRKNYYNSHNDKQLLKKYGLTRASYEDILEKTGGACCICNRFFGDTAYTKPVIDHCHVTGVTRGIICRQCNMGLGAFRDNCTSLLNAIKYLEDTINQ